jgi:uracil-DNA glycosylase
MDVRIESSWKEVLRTEFEQPYFAALVENVKMEYGRATVYPPGREIFAAFDHTPFDSVKVVIVGQDPYHGAGQANGLAFSVNKGIPFPPSLLNIFKEISAETGAPIPANGDLTRWADQGVLLLNASLTVREHQPKSHSGFGWDKFTDAAIRAVAERKEGVVFMLWGSDALRKGAFIDRGKHLVLTSPHPSPLSAYRGFFGNNHFTAANNYLISLGKTPIIW